MKSPFISPTPTIHSVDGKEFNFYPNRTSVVGKLRGFLKPIFAALSILSTTNETDIAREMLDESSQGTVRRKTSVQAIDVNLAKLRAEERERSIQSIVETLTSTPGLRSLALLIIDSMRDEYPNKPTEADLDAFIDSVTIDQMIQSLAGIAKASKEVFAPLMQRAAPGLAVLRDALKKAPQEEQPEQQSEESQKTPSGEA